MNTDGCNVAFTIHPSAGLQGTLVVPGDKSISHRAVMLGAIAEGVTTITGFLEGEDCLATLNAFVQMGVPITRPALGTVIISGVGLHGLKAPVGRDGIHPNWGRGVSPHLKSGNAELNLGNSGTSMRLLCGLLAGQRFPITLVGDESLSRRPMKRVTEPLRLMGASITTTPQGTAPLQITPVAHLQGITYRLPVASAQVKSCLLLAGMHAQGSTCVEEPSGSRDHTERMLASFGYHHCSGSHLQHSQTGICINGGGSLQGTQVIVPGDISSAAFFLVGASIAQDADLTIAGVGINPTRIGVIHILQAMGANIEILSPRNQGGEPVADLRVRNAKLHGINIPEHLVPLAIDEFPALFIAAACAEGETVLTGAAELRVKESDRIQAMADGLKVLGIYTQPRPDGILIRGGQLSSGIVEALGDHRIAMAFAMAGLRSKGSITIKDCANVKTSFPRFEEIAKSIGLNISCHIYKQVAGDGGVG